MNITRKIEQYLDGTLNDEERITLEMQAGHDKRLSELIRLHKEVNDSIRDKDLHTLHDCLKRVSAGYFISTGTSIISAEHDIVKQEHKLVRSVFFCIAAIVLIVFAAGIALKLLFLNNVPAEKLYHQYYLPYKTDIICRSVSTDLDILNKAINLYGHEEYTNALSLLEDIIIKNENNFLALFYQGLAYLETTTPAKAIASFNKIPAIWNSPYAVHRDWYLALALLKTGNELAAIKILNNLKASGGFYAKEASRISKKLKR